jgi:hypothetical protein
MPLVTLRGTVVSLPTELSREGNVRPGIPAMSCTTDARRSSEQVCTSSVNSRHSASLSPSSIGVTDVFARPREIPKATPTDSGGKASPSRPLASPLSSRGSMQIRHARGMSLHADGRFSLGRCRPPRCACRGRRSLRSSVSQSTVNTHRMLSRLPVDPLTNGATPAGNSRFSLGWRAWSPF